MLNKPQTILHLRITQSTVIRVIVNVGDQEKIDWYNENELHPIVLKALQPIILEHLVNDKATDEKRRIKALRVIKQLKFKLAYRFMSNEDIQESMLVRDKSDYRSIRVYPYHLSIFIDEPDSNLGVYFPSDS
ncbi:hypothetical protein BDA99DRAFT_506060 [Phascolomyces articulosus]|uniref:Uncharacterized protein n=1 Tax=Phascolomyces articulosus TaxID=60185 RepID=A0AAD5K2K2_9FUNG|nr:hypothetical protein BDA99DRAFT_506060 [Phascolomyces articulosus]